MTALRLHSYWRSSASYRVRIGLGLKQLAYDYVAVDIVRGGAQGKGGQHDDAYRALNPMGQVPTLEIADDGAAPLHLVQSLAILEYLDERWPAPPLLPATREARAQARALAEIVNAGIQPHQNVTTLRKVKALGGDDAAWIVDFVRAGLTAFDAQAASSAGRFCVGDAPTVADCCLVPQLYSARRFGVDPAAWPRLAAIDAACAALPAFAAAHPDRQPDAR
ncbi:MAG TPA: maleylacetoacetate isomerase [Kofleriaceae bacterium]|nr:maleylacetoacetate isomerase [Kofleriaceae bacterium]